MAPTEACVEWQTTLIIGYLFNEVDESAGFRDFQDDDEYEPDCPGQSDDSFDPVLIADKLRTIADALNDDPRFKASLTDLKQAAAQEAVEAAFSHGVEAVCEAHASKGAEVAPEMQLIRASVAFGLYIKKSSPELKSKVQNAMIAFLNRRVGSWVAQQGGWGKVPDVAKS